MHSLIILTHRRPGPLSQTLFSYGEALAVRGAQGEILIFDDSPESSFQEANLRAAAEAASVTGLSTTVINREIRGAFRESLPPAAQVYRDVLGFGLEGLGMPLPLRGPGGNRNMTLLYNVGRKALSADDDTRAVFRRFKTELGEVWNQALSENSGLPLFFAVPPGRIEELSQAYDGDPFGAFQTTLGEVPGRKPGEADIGPLGPVRIAMAGIYGGRWFSSPHTIFDTDPRLHQLLWQNEEEYRVAKRLPDALLLSRELLHSKRQFFITSLFGFDARNLLPPFFPGIRNEDGIWALLTRCIYPESPISYLPFAVEHDRDLRRPFSEKDLNTFSIGSSQILPLLLLFFYQKIRSRGDPAQILLELGRGLSSCLGLSKRSWRDLVSALYLDCEGRRIQGLEENLEASGGSPPYWAADTEEHIRRLRKSLLSAQPYRPQDYLSLGRKGEAAFRDYVALCGELLTAWPEIWSHIVPEEVRSLGKKIRPQTAGP